MKKIIVVILVIIFVWKCGCSNKDIETSTYITSNKWYQGGTLHKATILEWKSSSQQNKLATCADFIYATKKTSSLDEVKSNAIDLRICINEAVKDHEIVDQSSVSEIAAICLTLLNN